MTTLQVVDRPTAAPSGRVNPATRRQGLTVGSQLLAGVGNLVITAGLARALTPGEYGGLVAFLAAYVFIYTVASSVTAAVALDPALQHRLFRRALMVGLACGAGLVGCSIPLSPVLGLPVVMVVLLGASIPGAILLALARGRLYGRQQVAGTVGTLALEPAVRGLLCMALVPSLGTVGAAVGVVAAGYAALAVATGFGRTRTGAAAIRPSPRSAYLSMAVTLTFLLVAVIAAQDVIIANRLLPSDQAGVFAAVSTLGGAAYFATATIPMVLLASTKDDRGSMPVALGAAALISVTAVSVVAVLPAGVYAAVLGEPYRGVGDLAVGYMAAMAAIGVARVLLAELCTANRSPLAVALVMLAALTQLLLLLLAESAAEIVRATLLASLQLLVASAVSVRLNRPAPPAARRAVVDGVGGPVVAPRRAMPPIDEKSGDAEVSRASRTWRLHRHWPLAIAIAIGIVCRLIVTRSIWVDEAISVQQAQLSYDQMMLTLRQDDVHPPLFATILWLLVHLTGSTSEWVVRLPSLLAGIAFIPAMYAMARDLWDRRTAVVTGFVAAIAPVPVWYSQEARMYAIWMLLVTLTAWAQVRILRRDQAGGRPAGTWRAWVVIGVGSVGLLYLQWFAVLALVTQHAIFAVTALRRRSLRLARAWLVCAGVVVALFVPLVPFLIEQVHTVVAPPDGGNAPGQTGAAASAVSTQAPDIYAALADLIWTLWGYHSDSTMVQLGALWPLMLLACFATLGRARTRHGLVLVLIAAVPAVVLFMVGFERRDLFELRYFTSTIPMLLLFLSRLAASWGRGPLTRILLPLVVIASLAAGLVDQQVNQSNPRSYNFRGAVAWVEARGESDDVLIYAPQFLNHELAYYRPSMRVEAAKGFVPASLAKGRRPRDGKRSVFVFASFLDRPEVAAQVGKTLADLKNSDAKQVYRYEVANVTVWQFRKDYR